MPHVKRPAVSKHRPHHVTVRFTRGTWNLRSQRCFAPIRGALAAVRCDREGFRVVHFSVQHDHVHLVVEASNRRRMSGGMRALLIRIARGLNRVMGGAGRRVDDRYHEHVLKTPTEVRNAMRYVVLNRDRHLTKWGKLEPRRSDAFSSADPFSSLAEHDVELTAPGQSWLLTTGWQRAGPW